MDTEEVWNCDLCIIENIPVDQPCPLCRKWADELIPYPLD